MTKPPEADEAFDVALVGGRTEDGDGLRVLRLRPDGASIGEVRPLQEGRPIQGEVVQLKPRQEAPWVCDVETTLAAPTVPPVPPRVAPPVAPPAQPAPPAEAAHDKLPAASPRHGPPQVANAAYRGGWDRIFGEPKGSKGEPN